MAAAARLGPPPKMRGRPRPHPPATGTVEAGRLGGFLHCTRALGDLDAAGRKPAGLSAVPEVRSLQLGAEDEFVLLGSDGLWDVLDPAAAVALARDELRAYGDAAIASEKLVEVALQRKAEDNVSAIVLPLGAVAPPPARRRTRLALKRRSVDGEAGTPQPGTPGTPG